MKVSLRQPHRAPGAEGAAEIPAAGFLDPRGPFLVLGGMEVGSPAAPEGEPAIAAAGPMTRQAAPVVPLRVRADTMFGPRGVALGPGGGPLVVCDTGHHRLLLWHRVPERDGAPADLVLGQADFTLEGRNGRGRPGPATFNVPTGVVVERDLLIVADAWNHRVLIWHRLPKRSNAPADVVLGQADFTAVDANRGRSIAGAETLNWCYGVALVGDRLVVADTGNRRVLIWHRVPTANGQPADLVLGQRDFQCRDENAGGEPGIVGMRWPHAASGWSAGGLQVADAGNHRILLWRAWPAEHGTPPDLVLGQRDLTASEPNGGGYWPDAGTVNMPYGLATVESAGNRSGGVASGSLENDGNEGVVGVAGGELLVVADTANSRLLAWPAEGLATGAPAMWLIGQEDFGGKGDNRWRAPARDSFCWPYSLSVRDGVLAIADSGNNRVMLWRLVLASRGSGSGDQHER